MSSWPTVLKKPDNLSDPNHLEAWFSRMASALLNNSRLLVGDEPHRFVEIEFYYYGDGHPDPFTHRDPIQLECGRWYFHRSHGVYKSGSFKGFDLTFGDGRAFGGILIRGLETPAGDLVDGPSLCVDHLLARCEAANVAALDEAIEARPAWDPDSPLVLEEVSGGEQRPLYQSPRVGLSLKKTGTSPDPTQYIMRPYRCLSEPRRTSKGKLHVVLALHAQGTDPDRIHQVTGCPRRTVQRYIEDFEAGRREADFAPYVGIDLGPKELCKLYGTWCARWGTRPPAAGEKPQA